MKLPRSFLVIALLCGVALAQNLEFGNNLQVHPDRAYPYLIAVKSKFNQSLENTIKLNRAGLTPVTAGLGRKVLAKVHFDPEAGATIVMPTPGKAFQKESTIHFRIESDAPIGVYNLVLEFTGWKPIHNLIALNPKLKFSTVPHLGEQYLFVGAPNDQYSLAGQTLSPAQLNNAVFTLKALEENKAVFAVENIDGDVTLERQLGKPFPGLGLIIVDPVVETLSQKFVGKQVWGFGGFKFNCSPVTNINLTYYGNFDSHIRVKRIFRLAFPSKLNLIGSFEHNNGDGDFLASTPLAIQFDQTQDLVKRLVSGSASDPNTVLLDQSTCATFTKLFADPWQLERLFSLNPASARVPRQATSLIGLDRWHVAWLMGLPNVQFGTLGELMKLPEWLYEGFIDPTRITFKNNRVVKVLSRQMP